MQSQTKTIKPQLIWTIYLSLGLCLASCIFALTNLFTAGGILSTVLLGFWAVAVFLSVARMGYLLELNAIKGYYKMFASLGLLVGICSMSVGVCLVILGFVGTIAIVPISSLLLVLSVLFAGDFFSVSRLGLMARIIGIGFILSLAVLLASFVF